MQVDLTTAFDSLAKRCREELFGQTPVEFRFRPFADWSKNETAKNKALLSKVVKGKVNIYSLWTRDPGQKDWVPQYVGERKSGNCRQRLREHLFKKSGKVNSKLNDWRNCDSGTSR